MVPPFGDIKYCSGPQQHTSEIIKLVTEFNFLCLTEADIDGSGVTIGFCGQLFEYFMDTKVGGKPESKEIFLI